MMVERRSKQRQRGVLSIEAVVVSSLVAFALVGVGGWIKYDADYKNDRAAADNLNLVLQGAQSWFNANTATIAAAANPIVTYPYATWQGSVSSAVGASNIYGQTYSMRVYKEPNGQLDMLVVTTGGSAIPDGSLQRISKMMGGAGGYVSNAQPGLVQNPVSGWSLPVANIGGSPGTGHLAAAAFFASAATTNDYLYRHAVSGHPELQQMGTAIDMVNNNINNAGTVTAQKVVAAVGGNVQVGNSVYYGDGNNSAIYQNGSLFIAHPNGAAADIAVVGNVNSTGTVTAGALLVNGNSQVNGGELVYGNSQVVGNVQVNGSLNTNGIVTVQGLATPGTGCGGSAVANSVTGSGTLLCQSGVWRSAGGTFSVATYSVAPFTSGNYLGVHAYCAIGQLGGSPAGGWQKVYTDGNNNWWGDNTQWDGYAGQVVVNCLNMPGAGM